MYQHANLCLEGIIRGFILIAPIQELAQNDDTPLTVPLIEGRNRKCECPTIDNGISQHRVRIILQYPTDFIWFGAWVGLYRYDSYPSTIFTNALADPLHPNYNLVTVRREDAIGNLWGSALGEGLNILTKPRVLPLCRPI